jgi:hypothetical protein
MRDIIRKASVVIASSLFVVSCSGPGSKTTLTSVEHPIHLEESISQAVIE